MEMGLDVQECIRQEARQGFKVVSDKYESGGETKKTENRGNWDKDDIKGNTKVNVHKKLSIHACFPVLENLIRKY
jgi:hypothetical protein